MSLTSGLLFAMTIATALVPVGLVWMVIRYLHSRSRNELWQLRDCLVDDLLSGRLGRSPGADRLLRLVETHIRVAGRHTLGDLLVAMAVVREEDLPPIADELFREGVTPSDRLRLDNYLTTLWHISIRYLLSSSPIGWSWQAGMWLRATGARMFRRGSSPAAGGQGHARPDPAFKERPALRKARRVEFGYIPEVIQSKSYRRKRDRGPILEDLLSTNS